MHDRSNNQDSRNRSSTSDNMSGKGRGPQGIDKAPGEETSQSAQPISQETQKGKKVDADPSQENDRPANQPDIY